MSDRYFCEILGVAPGATRDQIRLAWRRRVMENHPDRFPREQKELQELAMITLTEAYTALMSAVPEPAARRPASSRPAATARRSRPPQAPRAGRPTTTLGPHSDPAYAYYKQGFINFSLAIHGVAEINRRIAAGRVPPPNRAMRRRYDAAEDISGSLAFLREAHGYFDRVVKEHGESMWAADARLKLRRIENFTEIYRRILANLKMR